MAEHGCPFLVFQVPRLVFVCSKVGCDTRAVGKLGCVVEEERFVLVLFNKRKSLILEQVFGIFCRGGDRDTVGDEMPMHIVYVLHLVESIYRTPIVGVNTLHVESVILRNRLRLPVSNQVVGEEAMSPRLIVISVREVESLLVRSSLGAGQTNAPLADKTCGVPTLFKHLGHRNIFTQQVILSPD